MLGRLGPMLQGDWANSSLPLLVFTVLFIAIHQHYRLCRGVGVGGRSSSWSLLHPLSNPSDPNAPSPRRAGAGAPPWRAALSRVLPLSRSASI